MRTWCASQRSGSTLLGGILAATGVAGSPQEFFQYFPTSSLSPQPREWFAGVDDPDIIGLLDENVPGTVDTRTSEQWRAAVLAAGATGNGVGRQTDVESDATAGRTIPRGDGSLRGAIRWLFGGTDPLFVHVPRQPGEPGGVDVAGRADAGMARRRQLPPR